MAEVNMQDPGTLLQARLTAPADLTIQAILRGQFVGMILMAIVRYLRTFTSEPLLRYTVVFPVFFIATFQSTQIFYWTSDLLVTHYADVVRLAYHNWWIESQPALTACVMFVVQAYYAKRLWVLRGRSKWMLVFYSILLPLGLLAGSSMTYWSRSAPLFRSWRSINVEDVNKYERMARPCRIVGYVLPTLIDLSIMFGMLWTLYRAKIDSDSVTQSLVRRLVAVVIETMTLPTLCMTLNAIMGLVFGDANSNERIFSYCQSQLCLFSLLRTLLSRQDLRNILDKAPSLPTMSALPFSGRSVLSRDVAPYSHRGEDRERVDGMDPIHIYNRSFEDRYQEQESRGRGFLTSSMEEKGRWRAQSGDDGFTKVTQRNGNGKISPQQALTRSIMKDYRVRQRNTRANMVDFVNSDSEECVLPPPIQTVPVKIESNASQTASVFSEYALSLDSRQKIVPPTQPSVSFEATRLPAPPRVPLPAATVDSKSAPLPALDRRSRFEQEVMAIKDFYRSDIERLSKKP